MTRWLLSATQYLFILTEAVCWFIVIRVAASSAQHGALTELLAEIEGGAGGPPDDLRVHAAIQALRDGIDGIAAGPSVLIVVVAAFAAFFVSRTITQLRLPRPAAALLGIVSSVVVINALLHVAIAGDLLIWDSSGLARFIDNPQTPLFAGRGDAEAFVANPDVSSVPGASLAMVVFAMFALWGRFLFVGRGTIQFDRALRSFTVGFPIVMIAVLVSQISGVAAGIFALPYFVLAMLTLAVANGERSAEPDAPLSRAAPWAVSALVTLGLLAAVAMLFGLVAALEVERVLTPVGTIILRFISWVVVIVLTPMAWVIDLVFSRLFANMDLDLSGRVGADVPSVQPGDDEDQTFKWPSWISAGFRLAMFTLMGLALYQVARYLFFRRADPDQERGYAEERGSATATTGFASLLRNLVPGRRQRPDVPAWLDRHAVYRLFARAVNGAEDRGFRRRPGETPLEFAVAAERVLDASLFPGIAAEFDRARYGRHYATDEELQPLDRALGEWERAHPATDELRRAVSREAPDDDDLPPEPRPERPEPPISRVPPSALA